jgi:predicted short-subunit dehydrogenase-like oxidoreductase (DUF2520 family)
MTTTLNIIGAGHVGRALGRLFAARGVFSVQDVLTRSRASAQAAVDFIGAGDPVDAIGTLRPARVWMLAVLDDRIAEVAQQLAASCDLQGAVVFHCSGAKASTELDVLRRAGALAASVHPVRSFADPQQVADAFDGTFCGVEGDEGALALLNPALKAIGARVVGIDARAKTVYHAASVFASNYLVTVLDAARELARPLATEPLANVFRLGPETALSGPIARGDTATVARQQAAVEAWDAPAGALYEALAAATWDLAGRKHANKA